MQRTIAIVALAVVLGAALWMTALAWWASDIADSSEALRDAQGGQRHIMALMETEMLQAKWKWDDPETPAFDPIEITLTQFPNETLEAFRTRVREAKAAFPPVDEGEGG